MALLTIDNIEIDSEFRHAGWKAVPEFAALIKTALSAIIVQYCERPFSEISLLFTDDKQMRSLNRTYRKQDKSTNVLSFPTQNTARTPVLPVLGDIVLAFETVQREADGRGISLADHTAHLIIHGYLHLQGLDHQNKENAEAMEALEINALERLGISNPYDKDVL